LRAARAVAVAVAVAVAAAVLAGCGGDDGAGGSPEAGRRTPASTASSTSTSASTTTTAPVDLDALRPPPPAGDPAALAAQITDAERALHEPDAADADVARAALAQQVAYRQLGDHPGWDPAVMAALPADLRGPAAAHAAARRELRALGTPKASLPAWRIVAPDPLPDLEADYHEAADRFGLAWPYLAAVHLVETATGRIRGTSDAGAQGPMQFLPSTWAAYGLGGDIEDTHDAIVGAASYLAANGGATDMANALRHYNHSDRYVRAVTTYAQILAADPLALRALYHWGVWYRTVDGDVYLPVGYPETPPS
jgi:membrane-bound lytic murein transglycosylase B